MLGCTCIHILTLNEETDLKLHRGLVPDDCLWLGPPWLNLSFSLALNMYGSLAILFSFLCDDALHKLGNIHVG